MAVTETELTEALKRAATLMSPEGQRRIDFASKQNQNNYDSNGDYQKPSSSYSMSNNIHNTQKNKIGTSNLPKAIMDSIMNNPLDDKQSSCSTSGSILDNLNYTPKRQEQVNEVYTPIQQQVYQQPQQYVPQTMNIDYNYIRSIVNECIKSNIQEIKEEILKESTLKTIRVGGENKIQLIDNKNNLYESRLEFKKNLSKK
jgi:hypothetical protein